MSDLSKSIEALFQEFKNDLLRWNRQINLVSRQETDDRLEGLFKQCLDGEAAVVRWIKSSGLAAQAQKGVLYFDLGSGGGFPGIIWNILFHEEFGQVNSFLVEPREKRAWFLHRLNRISGMPTFETLHCRWDRASLVEEFGNISNPIFFDRFGMTGDTASFDLNDHPLILLSLKALFLDDSSVLEGLCAVFSGCSGVLAGKTILLSRFYPPEQRFDSDLVEQLKIPSVGEILNIDGHEFRAEGGEVLSFEDSGKGLASLVASSYKAL